MRARALFARRRVERELDEELAFHIEREARKLIDEGLSEADAQAAARARFGSVPRAADECRDARGTALIDNTVRDIRYALRGFSRAPLVALTVVVTVGSDSASSPRHSRSSTRSCFASIRCPACSRSFECDRPRPMARPSGFTRAQLDALRRDTSVFTDAYASWGI